MSYLIWPRNIEGGGNAWAGVEEDGVALVVEEMLALVHSVQEYAELRRERSA
jgi:hypothetical protein|eukprot:COSAG01_NODE_7498_length_3183_cov_6.483787_2_plen_52_part_00